MYTSQTNSRSDIGQKMQYKSGVNNIIAEKYQRLCVGRTKWRLQGVYQLVILIFPEFQSSLKKNSLSDYYS